jgi:hypothetical protein
MIDYVHIKIIVHLYFDIRLLKIKILLIYTKL